MDRREIVSQVVLDIANERERQISVEGWTVGHDDAHDRGQLACAAACYAVSERLFRFQHTFRSIWPWQLVWWKPRDRRRDLVRAGALIVAEIERLDRASERLRPPVAERVS